MIRRMTRPAKIAIVASGYAVALLVALLVVRAHVMATTGADRQGAPGMFGFGDDLLFLGVLGVAAIPATSAALFFLRPLRAFWRVASLVASGLFAPTRASRVVFLAATAIEASVFLWAVLRWWHPQL